MRSTRRLALECERNLEVIWLLGGLAPGYRSIGEFRKDNAKALEALARDFVQLCRELKLIGGEQVGIDGSHFKANAGADSVKTEKQLAADLAALEREIERYHTELDATDAAEAEQDCFHCPGGRRLEPYRKPVRRDGGLFKGLPGRML